MDVVADHKAIIARVTGRVQGVGYRYTAAHMARELGLCGWVCNVPDGLVETRVQGDERVLEQYVAFLEQGPRAARVRSVDGYPVEPDPSLDAFTVCTSPGEGRRRLDRIGFQRNAGIQELAVVRSTPAFERRPVLLQCPRRQFRGTDRDASVGRGGRPCGHR